MHHSETLVEDSMLSLIVKGNRFQAAQAAAERGIPAVFKVETKGETVLLVGEQHEEAVARWFTEPDVVPYPVGACLFYSRRADGCNTHAENVANGGAASKP